MSLYSIILIAVGLAMDAFAVSVCKGLSLNKVSLKNYVIIGVWFGGFQALMPLIGFFIGSQFKTAIESFDHYIAFALLAIIGFNMIRESFSDDEEINPSLDIKTMLLLAIATSIDALAVGITFALSDMDVSIFIAVSIIAVITFIISVIGVKLGNIFGEKYKARAEIAGGIILILLGVKIFLEHLGIIDVIF